MSDFKDIDNVNAGENDEGKNTEGEGQEKLCSCTCDCGPRMDPQSASTGYHAGNLLRNQVR